MPGKYLNSVFKQLIKCSCQKKDTVREVLKKLLFMTFATSPLKDVLQHTEMETREEGRSWAWESYWKTALLGRCKNTLCMRQKTRSFTRIGKPGQSSKGGSGAGETRERVWRINMGSYIGIKTHGGGHGSRGHTSWIYLTKTRDTLMREGSMADTRQRQSGVQSRMTESLEGQTDRGQIRSICQDRWQGLKRIEAWSIWVY